MAPNVEAASAAAAASVALTGAPGTVQPMCTNPFHCKTVDPAFLLMNAPLCSRIKKKKKNPQKRRNTVTQNFTLSGHSLEPLDQ